ncbi:hypothetical protein OPV22_014014 [Ensete ventricosum]|uniref:Uncharacterized protein n=1 Tax=Ensete ventricosum TaxID=4639 RepID=A0AAV8PJJ1_ENSVE|nr:hypothetical protein OPV22_014014 [Ensete ventricosum]
MGDSMKRVLLTSAGDEISKGIAYHLAKAGCRLVLMGDKNQLQKMVGDMVSSFKEVNAFKIVGLNMEEDLEAVFDEAVDLAWKLLGTLDAFVNCCAYEGKMQGCLDVTEHEYKKTVKINFMAPWSCSLWFKFGWCATIGSRIMIHKKGTLKHEAPINVDMERISVACPTSVHVKHTYLKSVRYVRLYRLEDNLSMCDFMPMQIVLLFKFSESSLPLQLSAMEIGKHKIRVNAVSRGLQLDDEYPRAMGKEKAEKPTADIMPLLRWLDPKNDVASTVMYLVGDDSRDMTGTTIFVDGAQSIVRPRMRALHVMQWPFLFLFLNAIQYNQLVWVVAGILAIRDLLEFE